MVSKIIGFLLVVFCVTVSVLRGLGIMEGDFIIPLILLSQLFILGYVVQLVQILVQYVLIRYNVKDNKNTTTLHTWN